MKVFVMCSILLLFSMISLTSITQDVFADHAEVTIEPAAGSGAPGCEETPEGCFIPSTATVDVGGKVIFSNTDSVAHTFTSGMSSDVDSVGAVFDSSLAIAGSSFEWSPTVVGEQPYFCIVHPWMEGLIIVQEVGVADEEMMEKEAMMMEKEMMEKEAMMMEKEMMEKEAMMMEKEMMEKEAMMMEKEMMEKEAMMMEKEMMEKEAMMMEKEAMMKDDDKIMDKEGGGCLIATAAYGTELAPQVQFLREIRDNTVMSTTSGTAFMSGFNQLYYSFSPSIADLERENPVFQEAVRAFITPMISTLSIMTLAEDGSEIEVLGLGISVIALNLGMYVAAPALVGFKVHQKIKSRK